MEWFGTLLILIYDNAPMLYSVLKVAGTLRVPSASEKITAHGVCGLLSENYYRERHTECAYYFADIFLN